MEIKLYSIKLFEILRETVYHERLHVQFTVKPFNLAALKVGDLACKIILALLILAN